MRGVMMERVVRWTLNGVRQPPFLCTPEHLDDLALGYLLNAGMVDGPDSVTSIEVGENEVAVRTAYVPWPMAPIDERLDRLAPLSGDWRVSVPSLKAWADELTGEERYYGTHRIGLFGPQGAIFREDIGRHNAADKAIGAAVRRGWDLSRCALGATGRISLEILAKAASAGIPVLFSKKYPSDLSGDYASRLNLGIAAQIQSAEPVLSGAVWRFDNRG